MKKVQSFLLPHLQQYSHFPLPAALARTLPGKLPLLPHLQLLLKLQRKALPL